jgi:hypothetical protein
VCRWVNRREEVRDQKKIELYDESIPMLEKADWRVPGSGGIAEFPGLKRTTLRSKMKKLRIKRPTPDALIKAFCRNIGRQSNSLFPECPTLL